MKSFEKVPHHHLLAKAKAYGIGGDIFDWIRSYRSDCKQMVQENGTYSARKNVTSGIPQGSGLRPMLFVIYTDSLDCVSSNIILFADDTKLPRPGHTVADQDVFQQDLNALMT